MRLQNQLISRLQSRSRPSYYAGQPLIQISEFHTKDVCESHAVVGNRR